jgi:hypothetical protein
VTRINDPIVNLPTSKGYPGFFHPSPSYYITNADPPFDIFNPSDNQPGNFPVPTQAQINIVPGNEVNVPVLSIPLGVTLMRYGKFLGGYHISYFGEISSCNNRVVRVIDIFNPLTPIGD